MAAELRATWPQVLKWRMRRHLLDPVGKVDVVDVVRQLCGVQAQVPAAAALPGTIIACGDLKASKASG